jgi:putative tricarboxylic transport membrane protein
MRKAELSMAIIMALFSIYLMWKSTELPIGWIKGEGPGGGAFPFWLSAGMLVCCIAMIYRWWRRLSPPSQSDAPFMDRETVALITTVALSVGIMIGLIHVIGVFFSLPLFLAFYMRYLGRHSWRLIIPMAILTPVVTFAFFEMALKQTLPKGFTEPLFYPIYDLMY